MVNARDYLVKAQAIAEGLPSGPPIKLHKWQCSCLQKKLKETLKLVEKGVVPLGRVPLQYEEVFEEIHRLVRKVKTFLEDCCYKNEDDFVLAAIRVIAHRPRFFQYHVELDWCSFLFECLWKADKNGKPVYCRTLQSFNWEQKLRSFLPISGETSNMIAGLKADEEELKAELQLWIKKPGEHQSICLALLSRFGSETDSPDLHVQASTLEIPPLRNSKNGKFIGSGSFGQVHEFRWKKKVFAVKNFQIANVETTNSEVRILERCCHPQIVNLILAYKADTTQYLMMERLSCDLESYIVRRKKHGPFPVSSSEAVDMISQICEGLLYLNESERKVSHRDLKPRNVLVKKLSSVTKSEIPSVELQVADFGTAKQREEKSSASENTPNCGTLSYRAPEMTGESGGDKIRESSLKADIYSFAVTCSFILTGTTPYSSHTTKKSLKQAIKNGERPHLPNSCPPALATLLEWCWNSDPAQRPESFYEIRTELRKLKADLLTGAIEGVEPPEVEPETAETPKIDAGGREKIVVRDTEPPEEPELATFNPGDRTLNILVLGDPDSVESIVSRICGARGQQTPVQGHVNLTESTNSSPPMCLYGVKKRINRNDYRNHIRTFVKGRNKRWLQTEVEALWEKEVRRTHGSDWSALFRGSNPDDRTSRLHMVWFLCRKLTDLPNLFEWREIMKMLCGLPVQILVIEERTPGTQDVDMNVPKEFDSIRKYRGDFFPNAQEFMEDLVVNVDLQEDDPKVELWRKCWAFKTRVEIKYAAEIMREIRKRLRPAGISVHKGYGGARLPKEVSLSRSGEFILHFLCAYWDVPQGSLRIVLQRTTAFIKQARGRKIIIEPGEFVEFCLKVAAIILYNTRDDARNPKYFCSWNVSSESIFRQFLTEAQECYNSYFSLSPIPYQYDKMKSEDIRQFLEAIFERNGWDAPPLGNVDGNSLVSKIKKRIFRTDSRTVHQ